MRLGSVGWIVVLIATGASAAEKESNMENCPMHKEHMAALTKRGSGQEDAHFAGVTERGDKAMGFPHERTVHHSH
jgi:hypothetical protein